MTTTWPRALAGAIQAWVKVEAAYRAFYRMPTVPHYRTHHVEIEHSSRPANMLRAVTQMNGKMLEWAARHRPELAEAVDFWQRAYTASGGAPSYPTHEEMFQYHGYRYE